VWALLDELLSALQAEFDSDVQFHANLPANFTAPSVVVAPDDPFIEPTTHGLVNEHWNILVVYSATAPDRNVTQMRQNSLRVMRAVHSVGALWVRTTGPRRATANEADTTQLVQNQITFRYSPSEVLADLSDSS
jgi:hypothetical protein